MSGQSLSEFWRQNKKQIGEALPKGIDELARVLIKGANGFELSQAVEGESVCWFSQEGQQRMTFHRIADPGDLDMKQIGINDRSRRAVKALESARDAEAAGLDVFEVLVQKILD